MRLDAPVGDIRHPVPDEILLDYVVGSATAGKSLLVQTHLAMCPPSQARFAMLEEIGGALLETLQDASLEKASVEAVFALDRDVGAEARDDRVEPVRNGVEHAVLCGMALPAPLSASAEEAADRRAWRTLGRGVRAALLSCSGPRGRTQFLHARPGAKILPHTHEGEELVLVLKGAFWDGDERYGPGDVAVADSGTVHAPVIDRGEDCLCLAVTEGPIRFVGRTGWLANRFNRF